MPTFVTKVRNIHNRGRIVSHHAQNSARCHARQAFAGFQDGQGTEQSDCIKGVYRVSHSVQVGGMFQYVHKDVRPGDVT